MASLPSEPSSSLLQDDVGTKQHSNGIEPDCEEIGSDIAKEDSLSSRESWSLMSDEEFEREREELRRRRRLRPHFPDDDMDSDEFEVDPRKQKWSESLKARLFGSADKDGNYFSYMFLDKIFGEARSCAHCGARGTAKLPPGDNSLKLFVIEEGIVGKQNIMCEKCGGRETVISGEDPSLLPEDPRLIIKGEDIRDYCKKVTHYEILHDLMEMLHIAAMDDGTSRKEKHFGVADFLLHNARKVCEEWCRAENAELRLKKFLRLREETLLTKYNPTFTPDCTEEYREMYELMAQSFRQNRSRVMILIQLLKESLIDNPTRSSFMMWLSIAMMHSENYPKFKKMYDPRSFMRVESSEYQDLRDRYLSLEVPLGIKKIPVIFFLFEVPRFYHYIEFMNQRLGKRKPRVFLTDEEKKLLQHIDEEASKMGMGFAGRKKRRGGKKSKTMVSPEAHLDFLTQQEEMDREKVYQTCRERKAKEAIPLGRERDKKYQSIDSTKSSSEEKQDPPVPSPPSTEGEKDVPVELPIVDEPSGEPVLTKAQIKRRRKKAAARGEQVDVDDFPNEAVVPYASSSGGSPTNKFSLEIALKNIAALEKIPEISDSDKLNMDIERLKAYDNALTLLEFEDMGYSVEDSLGALEPSCAPPERTRLKMKGRGQASILGPPNRDSDPTFADLVMQKAAENKKKKEKKRKKDKMSKSEVEEFMNDLAALSYPGIAEMIQAVRDRPKKKKVAVMADPFFVFESSINPRGGAVAFMKRKEGEAPYVPPKPIEDVAHEDVARVPLEESSTEKEPTDSSTEKEPTDSSTEKEPTDSSTEKEPTDFSTEKEPADSSTEKEPTDSSTEKEPADSSTEKEPTDSSTSELPITINDGDTDIPPESSEALPDPDPNDERRIVTRDKAETSPPPPDSDDTESENDRDIFKNFCLLVTKYLPSPIREIVEERKIEDEMDPVIVSKEEYEKFLHNIIKHGEALEGDEDLDDVDKAVFLPKECMANDMEMEELVKAVHDAKMENPSKAAETAMRLTKLPLNWETSNLKKKEKSSDAPSASGDKTTSRSGGGGATASAGSGGRTTSGGGGGGGGATASAGVKLGGGGGTFSSGAVGGVKYDRNKNRREVVKGGKKASKGSPSDQAVMMTHVNTELLKKQGFDVNMAYEKSTVIADKKGTVLHILEGEQTPEQIKTFLSKKYKTLAKQAVPGILANPATSLLDPKASLPDPSKDRPIGNRKKLKNKKKVLQEKQVATQSSWPLKRPTNPYSERLGFWAALGGPWPEGLAYGTDDYEDREVNCEIGDEELVKSLDHDSFGNHSMLKKLDLSIVDVPDEAAADTVVQRYMEPADLGPGIDPKVPRYIIPSAGSAKPSSSKKLPPGTTRRDVPILMKYAAPHKQMRAMDAMKVPYKYELTQVLTPDLDSDGEEIPDAPKRRAILSKITLLPKSRYRSCLTAEEIEDQDRQESMKKPPVEVKLPPQQQEEEEEEEEEEVREPTEEKAPKISKSQRKKIKKKMKLLSETDNPDSSLDPDEIVRSKPSPYLHDNNMDTELMMEGEFYYSDDAHSRTTARDKFKMCENCGLEIVGRILLCAGCKKVAYCNFRCQKASWKVHKKTCSYALRKDGKESTG